MSPLISVTSKRVAVKKLWVQEQRLAGWYKQRDNKWVTAWAYVFCTSLLRMPFSMIDASMWTVLVYFSTGLAPEPGRWGSLNRCSCFTSCVMTFLLHTSGNGARSSIAISRSFFIVQMKNTTICFSCRAPQHCVKSYTIIMNVVERTRLGMQKDFSC